MDKKVLDGIYEFMAKAYQGNWQYRFVEAPYMQAASLNGKTESVIGHEWACISFWFHLRRVCPELDKLINSLKLYEMLANHDLGETKKGDLPAHKFINDKTINKATLKVNEEEREIKKLGKDLPVNNLNDILELFAEMELELKSMNSLEAVLAKYLDAYSGMHFALIFGNNLAENSEVLKKIVGEYFVRYSEQLQKMLLTMGNESASMEIENVTEHILNKWKDAGINITT